MRPTPANAAARTRNGLSDTSLRRSHDAERSAAPGGLAAILWCAKPIAAVAQTPDLAGASLSDLLRIEVQAVFGASERLQPGGIRILDRVST